MTAIMIDRHPAAAQLDSMGVRDWPVWTCGVSCFDWTYDARETCFILEGEITVTPQGGEPVRIGPGDLVIFPEGMSCVWEVTAPVAKHYRFG